MAEPTAGLIAQPVRSLLREWRLSATAIGLFGMAISLPWCIKPLYGLLTDYVPLFGYRRKSYLILTSLVASVSLIGLYLLPVAPGAGLLLLTVLLLPTLAIAFSDVVADALMVEAGQPRNITGQLQSVQWAAMYSATILTGFLGGWLSEHHLQEVGFLICGLLSSITFLLAIVAIKEPLDAAPPVSFAAAKAEFLGVLHLPLVIGIGGFLFLWSFNPFSSTTLYLHMTGAMGFSESFMGQTDSWLAVGCVAASGCYFFYCRHVPLKALLHASVALGVLSTLAYWLWQGHISAILVSLAVGFVYMTANLIQFDLAARACPPHVAGTVFALLMSISNLSLALSTGLGGFLYEWGESRWGSQRSFEILVGLGGLSTAACWLLVPYLNRHLASIDQTAPPEPPAAQ